MKRLARGIAGLLAAAGLCLLAAGGILGGLGARMADRPPEERMRNVRLLPRPAAERQRVKAPVQSAAVAPPLLPVLETEAPRPSPEGRESVRETTIEGGLRIKNETGYWVDAAEILAEGPGLTLPPDEAQILIIHTHASEAYTQAGLDRYAASDTNRTEDTQFNIVRIGDELTELLTEYGLNVIHDRGIYDYPSYTGSYTRAGEAIEQYLQNCPGIRIVFDIHRDALGANGVVYKTMAEEEGTVASQIMLLVGTDESGLAPLLAVESRARAVSPERREQRLSHAHAPGGPRAAALQPAAHPGLADPRGGQLRQHPARGHRRHPPLRPRRRPRPRGACGGGVKSSLQGAGLMVLFKLHTSSAEIVCDFLQ